MKKVLFVIGSGIGNQVEALPAFVRFKREYGDRAVLCNTYPYCFEATEVIFGGLVDDIREGRNSANPEDFEFQVVTYLAWDFLIKGIPIHVNTPPPHGQVSEVEYNMRVTGLPCTDADFFDCGGAMSGIKPAADAPHFLVHDGYNKKMCGRNPDKWLAKSYACWRDVASRLLSAGFRVGSIGSKDELIAGTEDFTGLEFKDSVALMKRAGVLLANDTGTYHVANAIGMPNVVVFTFTSLKKNYDERFHRHSFVARRQLPCSPCQFNGKHYWLHNRRNCKWACRNIDPGELVAQAMLKLRR